MSIEEAFSLHQLGWTEDLDRKLAALAPELSSRLAWRVARVDRGGACTVLGPAGICRASTTPGRSEVTVGDWVVLDAAQRISAVLPRRSVFVRAAAGTESVPQAVAANVDTALVVAVAADPKPRRVERALALAWSSGSVPVVVLTKADESPDPAGALEEVMAVTLGAELLLTSAVDGRGLPELGRLCAPGTTAVLLGPSGAGKSSLVNALAGEKLLAVGDVRRDGRGRHTTAARQLVVLRSGGVVIDTPGLREIGLFDAEEGLDAVFADLTALAASCRFSDCSHRTEPGCSVLAAIDGGSLSPERLSSWRKLEGELHRQEARIDARAAREERRRWKALSQQSRQGQARRGHGPRSPRRRRPTA